MTPEENPDDNKMPLVEHLIELRKRLMISAVFFIVAFIGCSIEMRMRQALRPWRCRSSLWM